MRSRSRISLASWRWPDQLLGARGDGGLELVDVRAHLARELPLGGQRVGALHDLERVERLLQDEQRLARPEPGAQVAPRVVGVRRADHDLEIGVDLPEPLDGLEAVPAGRHAHVDEREREVAVRGDGGDDVVERLAALVRRDQLEGDDRLGGRRRAIEQRGLERVERPGRRVGRREDLAEVVVDRVVIVDDQDAMVSCGRHDLSFAATGSSSEGRPPPRPVGLASGAAPPSSRAALALAWRPKP
jgi:hypothetical protein